MIWLPYLYQIGDDEKSSSIETMSTMNTNKVEWFFSNEIINDIDESLNNFWWWTLSVTFTS